MPRQEHYWTTLENRIKRNFPHRNEPKGESSKEKEQKKRHRHIQGFPIGITQNRKQSSSNTHDNPHSHFEQYEANPKITPSI